MNKKDIVKIKELRKYLIEERRRVKRTYNPKEGYWLGIIRALSFCERKLKKFVE